MFDSEEVFNNLNSLFEAGVKDVILPLIYEANKINQDCDLFPKSETEPHYVLVLSHRKRVQIDSMTNGRLARARHDTTPFNPPDVKKGSMANMPTPPHAPNPEGLHL